MHEHLSLSVLLSESKRGATIDIHGTASMRCDSIFCEYVSVYGNTRAASNLNCSLCPREGRTVPLTQALQDKEPLTQKP